MARIRSVSPDICTDETLARWSFEQRVAPSIDDDATCRLVAPDWQTGAFVLYRDEDRSPGEQVHLYRFWDPQAILLYVGISRALGRRLLRHRSSSAWWSDVGWFSFRAYPTRQQAAEAELQAIHTENPRWNILGKRS